LDKRLVALLATFLVLASLLPAVPRDTIVYVALSSSSSTSPKVGDEWVYAIYDGSQLVGKSVVKVVSENQGLYTVEFTSYDVQGQPEASSDVLVDSKWGIKVILLGEDVKLDNVTFNPPLPLVFHPTSPSDKVELDIEAKVYIDGELVGTSKVKVLLRVIKESKYVYKNVEIPVYLVNQTQIVTVEGYQDIITTTFYYINNDFKLQFKIEEEGQTLVLESYKLDPDPLDKYKTPTTTTTTTTPTTTTTTITTTTTTTTKTTATPTTTTTTTTTTSPTTTITATPPPQLPAEQLPPPPKVGNEWLFNSSMKNPDGSWEYIPFIAKIENTVILGGKTLYNLTSWYLGPDGRRELMMYALIDDKYQVYIDIYVWSRYMEPGARYERVYEPPALTVFYPGKVGDEVDYTVKVVTRYIVNGSTLEEYVEYWRSEDKAVALDTLKLGEYTVKAFRIDYTLKAYYENGTLSWEEQGRYWVNKSFKIALKWEIPGEYNDSLVKIISLEYDPLGTTTTPTPTSTPTPTPTPTRTAATPSPTQTPTRTETTATTPATTTPQTTPTTATQATQTTTTEGRTTTSPRTTTTVQQPPIVGGGQAPPPVIEPPKEGGSIISNPIVLGAVGGGLLLVVIGGLGLLLVRRGRGQGGYVQAPQPPPPPPPQPPVIPPSQAPPVGVQVVRCPQCGYENPVNAKFCRSCGSPLAPAPSKGVEVEQVKVCPSCGFRASAKAKFCPRCGSPV